MILHIACEKVGHRQAPLPHQAPSATQLKGLRALYVMEFGRGVLESIPAGLPALQGGESGQVRKEAATAIYCKCRGLGSPLLFFDSRGAHELSGSCSQVAATQL